LSNNRTCKGKTKVLVIQINLSESIKSKHGNKEFT
jgi:hypothetical protein